MGTWFVVILQQARDAELSSGDQMKRASPDTSWMPHGSAPFAPRSVACGQLESSKPTSSQPSSQEEEHFQNCGEVTTTSWSHDHCWNVWGTQPRVAAIVQLTPQWLRLAMIASVPPVPRESMAYVVGPVHGESNANIVASDECVSPTLTPSTETVVVPAEMCTSPWPVRSPAETVASWSSLLFAATTGPHSRQQTQPEPTVAALTSGRKPRPCPSYPPPRSSGRIGRCRGSDPTDRRLSTTISLPS